MNEDNKPVFFDDGRAEFITGKSKYKDPEIITDTEGNFPSKFIPKNTNKPKVIVGNYGDDMSKLIEAARLAGKDSIVVLESQTKPEIDLKEALARETDDFLKAMLCTDWVDGFLPRRREKVKHLSKCGLPGCEKMSAKDYCCAEHCRMHKIK